MSMNTTELLSHLRDRDIHLWLEADRLRYSAANGAMTPELRAMLRAHKTELMAFLREAARATRPDLPSIQPSADRDELPLSFAQERLWVIEQLAPGEAAYNIPVAVRLQGPLNIDALRKALNAIVMRHAILRTTIHANDGRPCQVVAPTGSVTLRTENLSTTSSASREAVARARIATFVRQPFDLQTGPLLRSHLLQLDAQCHFLVLTMHHIVSDGWSLGILLREIQTLYAASVQAQPAPSHSVQAQPAPSYSVQAQPAPLPSLPIQYGDYAAWQRQWLRGDRLAEQLAYWRTRLGELPPALLLPTDRPRPAMQSTRGAKQARLLPATLQRALIKLSRAEGCTLFMTLLAAFQTLLYRYTHQTDISVGTPVAGRTQAETEALIGCFVNTLVMRTDLGGDPSFRLLLQRVREVALGAFAHQEMPFEKLVTELSSDRNTSRSPLFQVMFILQNIASHNHPPADEHGTARNNGGGGASAQPVADLTVTPLATDVGTANFDITLTMAEQTQGLAASIEYSTDLFDAVTIERMLAHLERLLTAIVANPDQSIATLPLLSHTEKATLSAWNERAAPFPHTQCIHQLFAAQAALSPDAIAVVNGADSLTYRELDQRSNQLAHHLQARGVGPETIVGICVERSLDLLVSLLGILKAGGAYLPLDPTYPPERLTLMLEDAQPHLVLTAATTPASAIDALLTGQGVRCETCNVSTEWAAIAEQPTTEPATVATAAHLAYVIYTSGSTGRPKGVQVTHRAVVNHNTAVRSLFRLSAADRVLQFATLNFDTAVEEIFPTLLTGATLVLRGNERVISGAELLELVRRHALTVLDLPTAYWHAWVAELAVEGVTTLPSSLRLVILGGDKVSPERFITWHQHGGAGVDLIDTYGPTEATVIATAHEPSVAERANADLHTLSIGRPIANTQIHLVDAHLQPVPIGVPGELLIGGAGVARGYLNRPDLTAEKFIPDPFTTEPGARLYRTGDLARYRPDGTIVFIGRVDHQVKVRGFRVELGEIEAALLGHRAVHEAVVIAEADPARAGEKVLIAYCALFQPAVATGDMIGDMIGDTTVDDLRRDLAQHLPDYMVPAHIVLLDALPRTPSNKIDRRALPCPDAETAASTAEFTPPGNEAEQMLAEIWQQVLRRPRVGIHDNFFALGGDSILGIQVVVQARQVGLHLKPVHLFHHQTVAELALVAEAAEATPTVSEQGIVTGPVPLLPIQQWFFAQNFAAPHHWNQSILLAVHAAVDPALLEAAVWQLVRHHDALRMRYSQGAAGWEQINAGVADNEGAPFVQIDLTAVADDSLAATLEQEAAALQATLDLAAGPLLRVAYIALGPQRPARLLIIAHHLVVDGVSWRILLEDLHVVYQQLAQQQPVNLPPKSTSFQQWAQRLREHANTPPCHDELTYWLTALDRWIDPLPRDQMTGTNDEATATTVVGRLTAAETETLLQAVPAAYRTQINDLLLTALVKSYSRWTGRRQLLIDLEGHGREELFADVDLSRTVGWFTTTYPVLLDLHNSVGPGDALQRVKETLRAIPNRGVNYGLLRYVTGSDVAGSNVTGSDATGSDERAARLAELPQAEISFNYLGQLDQAVSAATPFVPAPESRGPEQDPANSRGYLLDVIASVRGGELQVRWRYSTEIYHAATMQNLANWYMEELRALITHCTAPEAGGYTPSDFGLAKLNEKSLGKVLAQIGKGRQ